MGSLAEAAQRGEALTVLRLLNEGVDANDRDSEQRPAIGWATAKGLNDIVRALLLRGADPNLSAADGTTPLEVACKTGNVDAALLLIGAGANPNSKSDASVTPLTAAAGQGASEIVRALLSAGADVNTAGRGGGTPILYAAQDGHAEVVALLLDSGAGPNTPSDTGLTPLMQAARRGDYEIVKLLLERGALADLLDKYHTTARGMAAGEALLDPAKRASLERIQELLARHERAQPSPKMTPRDAEDAAAVEILRSDPSQVNERLFGSGSVRLTALQHSIVMNDEPLFHEALALGASIEAPDDYGSTPIMMATYNKRRSMVSTLAGRGANLRAKSGLGKTVLHHAVMHGDLVLAAATLTAGVPVDVPDNEGYTPLHCAIVNNQVEAVDLLLQHGANPALRTSPAARAGADKSAFDFAERKEAVATRLRTAKRGKWWKFWT
jgi:ankyrin repeat protein